jgi:3-methylcrotonyl-CoA carboxylase beta subunit
MLKPLRTSHLRAAKRLLQSISSPESSVTASVTTFPVKQNFKSSFKVIQDTPLDASDKERNRTEYKVLLEHYSKHVELAKSGGGENAIQRHTVKQKKLLASERIRLLLDDVDDFLELALSAGLGMPYGDVPRAGIITGMLCLRVKFPYQWEHKNVTCRK